MTSYCDYIRDHPEDEYNRLYHDLEYGFPLTQDNLLFERFVLEINQAGLSWITILRKKKNFHRAYRGFEIDKIAAFGVKDVDRLLLDAGIIRNRLKINAAIENARRIQALRPEYGSFQGWLDAHHPRSLDAWAKSLKQTFCLLAEKLFASFSSVPAIFRELMTETAQSMRKLPLLILPGL